MQDKDITKTSPAPVDKGEVVAKEVKIVSAQEFIFDVPLYSEKQMVDDGQINALFRGSSARFDGHCIHCKRESVFNAEHDIYLLTNRTGLFELQFECSRVSSHKITIYIFSIAEIVQIETPTPGGVSTRDIVRSVTLRKVGQFPSHADVSVAKIKQVEKVLDRIDKAELIRANGLAAVGVNIGAYVYLRRIIERLISRVGDNVITDEADRKAFNALHFDEKIEIIKEHLPQFIVEHKPIYKVLSVGIHALSEDECALYHEILFESILLILEQEKQIKEKEKHEKKISQMIKKIQVKKGNSS